MCLIHLNFAVAFADKMLLLLLFVMMSRLPIFSLRKELDNSSIVTLAPLPACFVATSSFDVCGAITYSEDQKKCAEDEED